MSARCLKKCSHGLLFYLLYTYFQYVFIRIVSMISWFSKNIDRLSFELRAAGSQQGQEKRESKREKRIANTVDAADLKDAIDVPAEIASEERRSFASSGCNLDASHLAADVVMADKSKECVARLDGYQSQGGEPALPVVRDHMEAGAVQKRMRWKKGHKACEDSPSSKLPSKSCSSDLLADNKLLLETAKVGSKGKNSLIGKEDSASRSANTEIPDLSANNSAEQNKGEASIKSVTNPLVDKDVAGVGKVKETGSIKSNVGSAISSSLHDVKSSTPKWKKRVTQKRENKSVCSLESFQENVDKLSYQVVQTCTSVINSSSLEITDRGSVDKNDTIRDSLVLPAKDRGLLGSAKDEIGKKGDVSPYVNLSSIEGIGTDLEKHKKRRKKKKNKDSSTTSVSSANIPSIPEIVEIGSERKISNGTPLVNNAGSAVDNKNISLTGSESKESNVHLEMNVSSDKGSSSYVHKKAQHKRKKKVSDYSQYNLQHDRNDSAVFASSLREELQSVAMNNKGASIRNDLNVTSTNSTSMTEIVGMGLATTTSNETSPIGNQVSSVEKENSSLMGSDSNKIDMLPKMSANSDIGNNKNSHVRKRSQHKGKKKVFHYSQDDLEPDHNDSSIIKSSVELESLGKNNLNAYDKNDLVLQVGFGDSGLIKIGDGNSANESSSSRKMVVDSSQVEDHSSIQTKTDKRETHKSLNCSPCPSPIRGVVDDFDLTDLLSKQRNQSDSVNTEDVSFSFQIALQVSADKSSASHSVVKSSASHSERDGSENGSPTVHTENAYTCTHSELVDGLGKRVVASSSVSCIAECAISLDVSKSENKELQTVPVLSERALLSSTSKKLLVLDLNGLLADILVDFRSFRNIHKPHKRVGGKLVFKRPFCEDFLKFCFERFDIGIWSSRKKYNVEDVVDYLMGDAKHKLLFCWDQSRCTGTGFTTVENVHKPLVLKELKKLWNKEEPSLPWEKGEYSPSNTLLVDDSPYKALCNPPHTAIFPRPYHLSDENDNSLGPGGDLRVYLEGLAMADDVQQYVQEHPFGQRAITATNPSWSFYVQIIDKISTSAST